jgi:hypothetical protein
MRFGGRQEPRRRDRRGSVKRIGADFVLRLLVRHLNAPRAPFAHSEPPNETIAELRGKYEVLFPPTGDTAGQS